MALRFVSVQSRGSSSVVTMTVHCTRRTNIALYICMSFKQTALSDLFVVGHFLCQAKSATDRKSSLEGKVLVTNVCIICQLCLEALRRSCGTAGRKRKDLGT